MKKTFFAILVCEFIVLGLTGCGEKETYNDNKNNNDTKEIIKLKDPIVEWCQLYNPNGFDTITCVISNSNKVDIDVTYDLVYYKDGKEVARNEDFTNFSVSSKHNDVIWANVDIPKSMDVDEVKMENIKVLESQYKSIDAEIKYLETVDDEAYFQVKHDKKPTLSNIIFLLYNDENKNKKCDKGELVVVSIADASEKEDKVSFVTSGYNYTDYEIYYNAY